MTWELEADIDHLQPSRVAEAIRGWFAADLAGGRITTRVGDLQTRRSTVDLDPASPIVVQPAPDERIEVAFWLDGATDLAFEPMPVLTCFGTSLRGMANIRARSPLVLSLGDRRAWSAQALPSGARLDEQAAVSLLLHLCRECDPSSVRLVNEQQVSLPINDHFIYHRDPNGFGRDLRELVHLGLHGGDGRYGDARDAYEPLSAGSEMMWCHRPRELREILADAIFKRMTAVESQLPDTFTRDLLEHALAGLDDDVTFEQMEPHGTAVWALPPLRNYLDMVYVGLMDAIIDAK